MAVLVAYLAYFVIGTIAPLQRRWLAVKKPGEDRGEALFAFQVMIIIASVSLVFPFFSPFAITGDPSKLVFLTLATGMLGAGYFLINYLTQKHVEASVSSVVGNVYTPITIVLATIFLGEGLTTAQILGTALLLVGVIVVSKKHKTGQFSFDRSFWLVILSGIMLAVALTTERALIIETGFTAGSMLSWWSQVTGLGIIALITRSKHSYTVRDVFVTGSVRALQASSWLALVFIAGNLSLVASITTFKVITIFIAAAIFLKERENLPQKIFGSVVAVTGLLLMI